MPVFQPVVQYYRSVKHVGTVIMNLYTGTLVVHRLQIVSTSIVSQYVKREKCNET